jgi:hypothetical protein
MTRILGFDAGGLVHSEQVVPRRARATRTWPHRSHSYSFHTTKRRVVVSLGLTRPTTLHGGTHGTGRCDSFDGCPLDGNGRTG